MSSVIALRGVTSVGEAVSEECESADEHESVEGAGADVGGEWAVVPGDEDSAEVSVRDDGGAEGDGAGAAVAGKRPGRRVASGFGRGLRRRACVRWARLRRRFGAPGLVSSLVVGGC